MFKRPNSPVVQEIWVGTTNKSPDNHLSLQATICVNNINLPVSALIDSGAEQNLNSKDLVDQLCIPTEELSQPLSMPALTGQTFASVSHKVLSLHIIISGNYHDLSQFFCFPLSLPSGYFRFPLAYETQSFYRLVF